MIKAYNISKSFDDIKALDDINLEIKEASVFGLVGTNGAGKSTLLKIIAGILRADKEGSILVDDEKIYENVEKKKELFYISDEQYFFPNSRPIDIAVFYKKIYPKFDMEKFLKLISGFNLDKDRKISTFSKGMKKQLCIILGIASNTKYMLCDETFDGLDPVMRQGVKSLFVAEIEERGLSPVIASHNLRELEDICEQVGLLHKGGVLFSKDLENMKLNMHKLQCVFSEGTSIENLKGFDILISSNRGSVYTLTIRAKVEDIRQAIREINPIYYEIMPLSLEEIFISETEVKEYDIKKLIF